MRDRYSAHSIAPWVDVLTAFKASGLPVARAIEPRIDLSSPASACASGGYSGADLSGSSDSGGFSSGGGGDFSGGGSSGDY
ncbi:hypothetical protein [Polaromonas sp.]|uniref:hypothetical protein n=1 Tax=Polaromonas sp. TaxID=1869339 RepID=UPI003529D98D